MRTSLKKLKYSELRKNMHVKTEQLSDLYGVWIYVNPETVCGDEVDILYFCTPETKDDGEIQAILDRFGRATTIFQPAFYADEDVEVYDD